MKIYDYAGKKNISGERIREARTRLHLTQTNLAVQLKLVGVDVERDSISRIEMGWSNQTKSVAVCDCCTFFVL